MSQQAVFADVVDAADKLSPEEQEELIDILRRRLADEGRRRIAADITQGKAEHAAGKLVPMSIDDIMQKARS